MDTEGFRAEFETTAQQMLQIAHDFVDHGGDVETIWVYFTLEDGFVSSGAAYRVSGTVYEAYEVDKGLASPVGAWENQEGIVDPISDLAFQFLLATDEYDNVPTRIIITYDVLSQRMDADFGYDAIDANTEDDMGTVMNKWMDNLEGTGEAKAAFLP